MIATGVAPPLDDVTEVVCPSCRLVQEPGARCASCAGLALVPLARIEDLVSTRNTLAMELGDPPRSRLRDALAMLVTLAIVAFAALPGTLLGWDWLSSLGAIAGVLAGTAAQSVVVKMRPRRRLSPVTLPALLPESPPVTGVVRTLGPPVRAAIAGRDALAVATTVTAARDGRVYFRRSAATELWLDWDEGERVLVSGEVWVDAPATSSPSALTRRTTAEMLALVGISEALDIDEPLVIDEWAIYPGQRVAATGELRRELIAGAGYRDHVGLVLRGEPGAPIHLRAL